MATCGESSAGRTPRHPLTAPGVGALPVPAAGDIPRMVLARRCARGRASGQDEPDQIAEEHSQGKATETPLQKYLGKAAEQTLNQNPGVTVQQKPRISFMNYLTVCLRARKYAPNHQG